VEGKLDLFVIWLPPLFLTCSRQKLAADSAWEIPVEVSGRFVYDFYMTQQVCHLIVFWF